MAAVSIRNYELYNETHNLYDITFYTTQIQTLLTHSHSPSLVDQWIAETHQIHRCRRSPSTPPSIVGLDVEWRPNFSRNINNPIAIIQLCVGSRCLIFQILHSPTVPRSLTEFLRNQSGEFVFVGVGIENDVEKMLDDYELEVGNTADLRGMAAEKLGVPALKNAGLKELTRQVLGKEIEKPKNISMSRWDYGWLTDDQRKREQKTHIGERESRSRTSPASGGVSPTFEPSADDRRIGETVSRNFHKVLDALMKLQAHFFKKPTPIPENCTDERWKWFKNCLGALDGTYIKIKVPLSEKNRYRTRKGDVATNVLGVCAPDMQFIYVLPGWEGSAADGRVLRDALSRKYGFQVPHGCYYLVDAGYANSDGFLAPFRGQRYHLSEWHHGRHPRDAQEFFNMKHSSARNVIERCFGLLKLRWGILISPSYYPVRTRNRIIIACCLLHNFIRMEHTLDPMEAHLDESNNSQFHDDLICSIEPSEYWSTKRMNLANEMFNAWNASRH